MIEDLSAGARATVTLRREADGPNNGKRYTVFADGVRVGSIEQSMVTHDRKPRGSRIVTNRTQSLRWFGPAGGGWFDSRFEAIAWTLAEHFDGYWDDYTPAARAATVERASRGAEDGSPATSERESAHDQR